MQAVQVQSLVGGAKIPHDSWPKNQNIKHRNVVVTNSIKALKMAHIKNLFLKNETGGSWWRMVHPFWLLFSTAGRGRSRFHPLVTQAVWFQAERTCLSWMKWGSSGPSSALNTCWRSDGHLGSFPGSIWSPTREELLLWWCTESAAPANAGIWMRKCKRNNNLVAKIIKMKQ